MPPLTAPEKRKQAQAAAVASGLLLGCCLAGVLLLPMLLNRQSPAVQVLQPFLAALALAVGKTGWRRSRELESQARALETPESQDDPSWR